MKIAIIVEGKTENAFIPVLRKFLETRLSGQMPKINIARKDGRLPTGDKLKRIVTTLLSGSNPADHVIALTDVYTGTNPPIFEDAKAKMLSWVGTEIPSTCRPI
ncbi:hypothetical protein [Candidatus Magnetominusculus dajiuhuensis]|uniref:hypothetical protein n=1 Tax=Candidatus Magnetominusculus dajiuhuensis TaxID=3137712 RepID=UPI003B4346E9